MALKLATWVMSTAGDFWVNWNPGAGENTLTKGVESACRKNEKTHSLSLSREKRRYVFPCRTSAILCGLSLGIFARFFVASARHRSSMFGSKSTRRILNTRVVL